MKYHNAFKNVTLAVAALGMVVPQTAVYAGQPVVRAQSGAETAAVLDIALANGGELRGQVVNPQGLPVADSAVSVQSMGVEVATAKTDADGQFVVHGLRGGSYSIQVGADGGVYRVWAPQTAPQGANQRVLIVSGQQAARGQNKTTNTSGGWFSRGGLFMLGIMGGIVAGGLISQNNSSS
jgi:hypothetical protein